jgi:uncharacterized protein
MRGRRVAGIGSPQVVPGHTPVWGTYVWVDDVDDALGKVTDAGGNVPVEPFEALDGGRMAVVSDPTGGVIAVWKVGENHGAQLVNEPSAWSMSVLHTRGVDAAKNFSADAFGWRYESFDAGDGAEVNLALVPGYVGGEPEQPVSRETVAAIADMDAEGFPEAVPPHWGVDFWIADTDAAVEKASELGGAVVQPPTDRPPFRSAVLADPQGAVFAISQLKLDH